MAPKSNRSRTPTRSSSKGASAISPAASSAARVEPPLPDEGPLFGGATEVESGVGLVPTKDGAVVSAKEGEKEDLGNTYRVGLFTEFTAYVSLALLYLFGHIREFYRKFRPLKDRLPASGYAPLVRDFDDFYTRRMYYRIRDCWNRPVDSRPSRVIAVLERVSDDYNVTFRYTGRILPCINLASYNYLGFAADTPYVTKKVLDAIDRFGIGTCSAPYEGGGFHDIIHELERRTAEFVGKEDAMACGMGFATNFGGIPGMFDKDTLAISDSLNHASLVGGMRLAPGRTKVFPHNNFDELERLLKKSIIEGQPRIHRPWKRIVIVTEGIYSMEGEITDLKRLVELKKKYKCLLFVDEAHSIGALGVSGRGVCEYCGVDPKDIDILMGTYTKSFGSVGGYIAGNKDFIQYLRSVSSINLHADTMAAGCAQQALAALEVILGEDGTDLGRRRIAQLADNSRFLRRGLQSLGLTVYGQDESPVIPVMLYNPSKMPAFSRECLKRGLAVVVVGYPATTVIESRVRFCVSAGHTREDLERVLKVVDEVASLVCLKYEHEKFHLWA